MIEPRCFSLSSTQQSVWFDQLLSPDTPSYNIGVTVQIDGAVDPAIFAAALKWVITQYDALRLIFSESEGQAQQQVVAALEAPFTFHDLRAAPDAPAQALATLTQLNRTPFALYGRPLWSMEWFQLSDTQALWNARYHHLICDGTSVGLIGQAVSATYNQMLRGEQPVIDPELAQGYQAFVAKDRAYLGSARYAKARDYWLEQFSTLPAPLFQSPVSPATQGQAQPNLTAPVPSAQAVWTLGASRLERLSQWAKTQGATLSHCLSALLAGYFSRMTDGREQLVIGLPVHNRGDALQKRTVGMFSSVLPLAVRVDGQASFAEAVQRVAHQTRRSYRHQRYPLQDLHRELRARAGHPGQLFELMLSVEQYPGDVNLGRARCTLRTWHNGYERYPLAIYLRDYEVQTEPFLEFNYDPRLFSTEQMSAHLKRLEHLTEQVLADPSRALMDYTLLDATEQHRVIQDFNATAWEYPAETSLCALFEAQVRLRPQATALQDDRQSLSYRQLDQRAEWLAGHLAAQGVKAGDKVALYLGRGAGLIVSILAILKRGAAYVPVDRDAPAAHLARVLADSGSAWLLCEHGPALSVAGVLTLDLDELPSEAPPAPPQASGANDVAYVMYTSGSTGVPKGVQVPHRAITRLVRNNGFADFNAQDRIALAANPAFDASTLEIWGALLNGGCLVVCPRDTLLDAARFNEHLLRHEVSVLWLTAGLFHQFAEPLAPAFAALRYLMVGGDVLDPRRIAQVLRHSPPQHLLNGYGPTESTTFATTHRITLEDALAGDIPIGKPIGNTQVYVLDDQRRPVPIGVAGELYIGGDGLALGYLNQPQLSEQRFVPHPFDPTPGARLYRTGDLARWRADGVLLFLGRNDFQVKIRGFRIELGEIEAQLKALPSVTEAVVLADAQQRLLAYFTATSAQDPSELRARLAAVLPDYMLPAAFVQVDAFSLTANGKLDRRALPEPGEAHFALHRYDAPQGPVETRLAELWAQVLGVPRVGRQDNFFALGGHSLLAVQMVEQLRAEGWSLDVGTLFNATNLLNLAATLEHSVQDPEPAATLSLDLTQAQIDHIVTTVEGGLANVQDIYPLAPLQEGLLFHHLLQPRDDAYLLRATLAFDSQARLQRFIDAFDQVIARHDVLRSAVLWEGLDTPVQVVWRVARLPVVLLDEGRAFAEEHLDIRRAPLAQAFVRFDAADQRWHLQLVHHHLSIDHATLGLLFAEVRALMLDPRHPLPPAIAFRQFVAQARQPRRQADAEAYFQRLLGDLHEPTLPYGLNDIQGSGRDNREAQCQLDPALSVRLRHLAKAQAVGVASLFHLAWAMLVGKTSGRDDVVFGTVLFGRFNAEQHVGRALGMFINTLPLRIDLDLPLQTALRQVHGRLVELLAHEHAPLALAQRCSALPAHAPLFSALLNFRHSQGQRSTRPEFDLPGIQVMGSEERSNYPFCLSVDDLGDEFALSAQIHRSVCAETVLAHMVQALHVVAQTLETAPTTGACTLDSLPVAQRQQLLEGFNQTRHAHPRDTLLHQPFERQAALWPDAVAAHIETASAGTTTLTYGQLNRQANRLAHALLATGLRPDDRVAICLERGPHMLVALLATLKAGAAYVPLDPTYPPARLRHMLEDSAPRLVLSSDALRTRLPATTAIERWDLDTPQLQARLDAQPIDNPDAADLNAAHLAYVIYTSGSTGMPKGVMIEHRNACNLLHWALRSFDVDELHHSLFATSINFDLAVFECFVPLAAGATLHLVDNALALVERPRTVSLINSVPSAVEELVRIGAIAPTTRVVNLAGEPLKARLVEQLFAQGATDRVCNLYGPTETTTYSTWLSMSREQGFLPGIGQPLDNTRIYLLDRHRQPVPLGVAGEIHIGGAGVARGYLNRAELTAERFLPDPFVSDPEARMYRTGDLGRWRADGHLEYLGRNDFQVKVRGFRIELGEIEAQLLGMPGLREAVVLAQPGPGGDPRLVAYLVAQDPAAPVPDLAQVRAYLENRLPDYMLPSACIALPQLPLTPNGKLDRQALPLPVTLPADRDKSPPRSDTERRLAAIWAQVLGQPDIGREDDFFSLGGHSLLAVQLLERLRRNGWNLDIRSVFERSTLAALAQRLDTLGTEAAPVESVSCIPTPCSRITPPMLDLVELAQAQIDRIAAQVPGGAGNIQDIYPLGPLQEGMLYHHRAQSAGDNYLLRSLLAFTDEACLQRFCAALEQVIARHDALRTLVLWEDLQEPLQVVLRQVAFKPVRLAFEGDVAAQLHASADPRHYRLDLRQAPLIEARVAFDAVHDRWLLLLVHHHVVVDHTSLELMIEEIALIEGGRQAQLSRPVSARGLVAHARRPQVVSAAQAFFSEQLGDLDEPTLPLAIDVQADPRWRALEHQQPMEPGLARRLRQQASAHGVSAASVCHLAWALVLSRLSGRDDVVFGTVLFGRLQAGAHADRALGLFINTLPLRVRLDGDVGIVLEGVQQALNGLLSHEQTPLALAQRCSAVPAGTALFSAMFNYRYSHADQANVRQAMPGMSLLHSEERTHYPFNLAVDDLGEGFQLTAQTHPAYAPARLVGFMLQTLDALVEALEQADDTPVQQLRVLPDDEEARLDRFNRPVALPSSGATLQQRFAEQAARTPDALAVIDEHQALSFRQLNEQANRLAHHLRNLGVQSGQLVAVCLEREVQLAIALLAVWKAGCAYVPLDPDYPAPRLAYMLNDSAPAALLTQERVRPRLPTFTGGPLLSLDAPESLAWTQASADDPDAIALGQQPTDLAYLIYTSGSTGQPKGVMVEHHSVLNLWAGLRQRLDDLPPGTRCSLNASVAFDASVQQLCQWLSGHCLVLIPKRVRLDASALLDYLHSRQVTLFDCTPTQLQVLLKHRQAAQTRQPLPRRILLGGEAVPSELWTQLAAEAEVRVLNVYGPTECTVDTTSAWLDSHSTPSLGQPLPNTQVHVLDRHGRRVPVGVAGEIHIGGHGVARGYWQRAALTDERFLSDPFTAQAGGRLYRTGDLGRWEEDGSLSYLGRTDFQVKIHGHRIELGEIESQLLALPGVQQAVVVGRNDRHGVTRLVAYLQGTAPPTPSQARAALAERLPDYMLPGLYVRLDSLPLTANGKLDRNALPEPDAQAYVQTLYEAPQGELEITLAALWCELLNVERVSRHDNFFALGGHSLIAMTLVERMRQHNLRVDISQLFTTPTLAGLAMATTPLKELLL
ncbi:amino acid adenylation domain-containing protein [Pseudomonas sp. 21TX0197]|uniref:non-ribosomal peptide synthetase n=2 Tax=unclassified Pseudomonas TaxID=196821 RepID=UPI00232F5D94|nr:non-ribosomal peptide synthetase [Pseudomonas sp. 21TX0197]MDB6442647.1 amino acid adenylation domain-containing protein [Pseudomonas sp. 21TX0197]